MARRPPLSQGQLILRQSHIRLSPARECPQMEATDRFGTYRVIQSRVDETGVWRCDHKYLGKEDKKAYHVIFPDGGHYFHNPDGTQQYYHPKWPTHAWTRESYRAPKRQWVVPSTYCVSQVNPPPRQWLRNMNIPVSELQNQLADRLDAFFRDRVPCDGSQESIRRLNEEVPRGPRFS